LAILRVGRYHHKPLEISHLYRLSPLPSCVFLRNTLVILYLHRIWTIDPCMFLVYFSYGPPMVVLTGSGVTPERVQGLKFTPKSGIQEQLEARGEGVRLDYAFQGEAGGRNADTSPAWSVRTSNVGIGAADTQVMLAGQWRRSGGGCPPSRRASAACG
jgi:hypothetical protein